MAELELEELGRCDGEGDGVRAEVGGGSDGVPVEGGGEGDGVRVEGEGVRVSDGGEGEGETEVCEEGGSEQASQQEQSTEKLQESQPQEPFLRYVNKGGNFFTGFDVTTEEAAEKRKQRAERFGLPPSGEGGEEEEEGGGGGIERRQARAKRFGTKVIADLGRPAKIVKSLPTTPLGEVRCEAVFLYGTDELSTEDILEIFTKYGPRNVEWIDDSSCAVVWEDVDSARRALLGVGRHPVALAKEFEPEDEKMEEEAKDGEEEEEKGEAEKEGEEVLEEQSSLQTGNQEPTIVRWRLAEPHPRAKQLLLRPAVSGDKKMRGAASNSKYYRKYGNPHAPPPPRDLRRRLKRKRKRRQTEEEEEEEEEAMEVDDFPQSVKRARPLHADRSDGDSYLEDAVTMVKEGEEEGGGEADLRKRIQKKRKKRELQLRLGSTPRLVEHIA